MIHLVDVLGTSFGVALDFGELGVREARVLREDARRDVDFAEVVQERAERQDVHVFARVAAEHAEHGREDGDVDAVRERVGVMQADVRELHEVFFALDDVADNVVRDGLHRLGVEAAFPLDVLERVVDVLDGIDARRLLHDVFRRLELEIGVGARDVDGRDADFLELVDVFRRDGAALDEVAAAMVVVDALGDDHALF